MRLPSFRRATLLAAIIIVANGVIPALWILLTSMKTETELMRVPITVLPDTPTIANYIRVFVDQPMLTFLANSFAVAGLSTLLCVFVSSLAAYAIVRLALPMGTLILSGIVLVSMFPLISLMVPLFQIMRAVELLNTSIEKLCDHVTPQIHPTIKIVKDMGSAAVLCALLIAGLVWLAALAERLGFA